MQRKSSCLVYKIKILLIVIIFALFLINPIVGLVGLALVLAGIFGYIFLKAKLEGKTQSPSQKREEKDELGWIDRIEEIDAATDDSE